MAKHDECNDKTDEVYYFKCSSCGHDIFWSDIRPSVHRAAQVFKWVRAGCPNELCDHYLTLSDPDSVYTRDVAQKMYRELLAQGIKAYWV